MRRSFSVKGALLVLAVTCVLVGVDAKSLRKRRDISHVQFPPPRRSFDRAAVERSPIEAPKSAALRDVMGGDAFGTKPLPLRAAVESMPTKTQRLRATDSGRIPQRDAVEQRPPAYDDDLFALTDELESLGIDPWAQKEKPVKMPDKYQDESHGHTYVIQLPAPEREHYSQLHQPTNPQNAARGGYYGAAKPYNADAAWAYHYAAYQQPESNTVEHYRIYNKFQELINKPIETALGYIPSQEMYGHHFGGRSMKLENSKLVVCYVESWSAYRKPPMNFSPASVPPLCTHVIYAFATMHTDSYKITSNDHEYDIVQGGYRTVTGLKRTQPGLKVLISVGGSRWSGVKKFSELMASATKRHSFINSAVEFCKKHGFDGVDLHWLYPGAEDFGGSDMDKVNLVDFLREMNQAFEPHGLIISMAVPGSRFRIEDGYNAVAIEKYLEWVTVEAFDYRADSETCSVVDHHSPLYPRPKDTTSTDFFNTVDYSVKYWMKSGMPANKIILGVPAFGRTYTLLNASNNAPGAPALGLGNEGEFTQTKGIMAYYEICDAMTSEVWIKRLDQAGSPYAVHRNQWVGYDNEESILKKMSYIQKMNLAGGALWALDMDDFRGLCGKTWPLLKAVSNGLKGISNITEVMSTKNIGFCNEDGLSSDEDNCASYILCRKSKPYRLRCDDGMLYDAVGMLCRAMDPNSCLPGQSMKNLISANYKQPADVMDHTKEYYQLKGIGKKSSNKFVVCYVTNWSFYRKGDGKFVPEYIDTRLCTHIVYAYASLDPEKLIAKEFDPWADIDNNLYARVTALKDSKVLLGLGGWTDSSGDKYSKLVSSGSTRRTFITNLIAFLRRHGFQGLQLDWNYPKCWQSNCAKGPVSDKPNFAKLVQELSEEFKQQTPKMELGVAISGYKEVIDVAYDLPSLGQSANYLTAMSYDYHGGWEPTTAHGSPLYPRPGDIYPQYTVDYTIRYLISQGAPEDKLLLGLAFYGQTYQLNTLMTGSTSGPGSEAVGPGPAGDITKQPGMLAYYEICHKVKNLRWQTGIQEGAGPYAFNKDQWVGYEDPSSIAEKVKYALDKNLGGVVAWTTDLDDFNNICCTESFPLLKAANRALGRSVPEPPNTPCERPATPATPPPPIMTTTFSSGGSMSGEWSSTDSTTTSPWWEPEPTTPSTTTTARTPPPSTTTTTSTTTPAPVFVTMTPPPLNIGHECVVGSYSPDPYDCGYYLQCSSGDNRRLQCAPGLHWNAAANLCDWPASAHCTISGTSPTRPVIPPQFSTPQPIKDTTEKPMKPQRPMKKPSKPPLMSCVNGGYYPHKHCNKFNICVNNVFISQICGPGEIWNQMMKICMKGTCDNVGFIKAASYQSPCNEGEFSAYPGDCGMFMQCQWGKYETHQCAAGLHWNAALKICDWPASAKCLPSTGIVAIEPDGVITIDTTTTTTTTTTAKPLPTPVEPINFVPYTGKYKIVCYFTNWAWYRNGIGKYFPEDIDPNLCTHIVYGFSVLDYENLVIKAHDSWADFDNRFYERVTAFKKKGLKVLLALGGWNDSAGDKYSRLVNNPGSRARFIEHAVAFLVKYNFDGLDLDWEYPVCWQTDCSKGPDTDKAAFAAWVRELHTAFQPHGFLLSSAVSASKKIIDAGYDVADLAKYMDWIAVMAYDFHGQWDKKTGHVAPLYYHPDDDVSYFNANYSMHYWISLGAPPSKLVMGMPLYGQSFTLGTSWDTPANLLVNKGGHGLNVPARAGGQAGEYTRSAGFLAYYEICDRIHKRGWTVEQDEEGRMGPHAYTADQWVGYDDTNMIRKKTEFIKSLNLGGAMVWALDLDDFRNTCGEGKHPLLSAIRQTLESGSTSVSGTTAKPMVEIEPPQLPETSMDEENPHVHEEIEPQHPEMEYPYIPETEVPHEEEIPPMKHDETPQIPDVGQTIETDIEQPGVQPIESEEETEGEASEYKVVCYFTNWAWYRQDAGKYLPSDIDTSLCTHILYGFAVLDTDQLIIKPHDSWADIDNKFYEKVTALRAKGVKVLLALGGWNDSAGGKYSKLVNNPSARKKFVLHALDFVTKYRFDGLDLDWEYPVCWQVDCTKGPASDKEGFSELVKELRSVFGPKNLLLSAAVSPNHKVIDAGYDVKVLSDNLDWIAVMTYDYHGQWDKKTGHVAPMYVHPEDSDETFNANYTIHHWLSKGAARSKLVMGMSLYGQSFSLAEASENGLNAPTYGGGEAGDYTRARGFLSYYEICDRVKNRNWQVVRDPRGKMGPYAYKGDQWVSFDDLAMIKHKSLYIKAMGLGGGMVWALDLDDFRGSCGCEKSPLLSAAARELGILKTPQPFCQLESAAGAVLPPSPPSDFVTTSRPVIIPPIRPVQISTIPPPIFSDERLPCLGRAFVPHPDCNKYYLCNQGSLLALSCPPGLHWALDHCDWPSNAKCTTAPTQTPKPQVPKPNPPVVRPPVSQITEKPSVPAPVVPVLPPSNVGPYKVVCYFTNWAWYRSGEGKYVPADIDPDLCTHIIYGFAVLDSTKLTIMPHDSWADIDNEFYNKVTAFRAKGKKVLIAIGGWNDSMGNKYSRLVNDAAARARFVADVLEFILKWHFDGLDLDWEYPKCWQVDCNAGPATDKEGFAKLVKELKQAFKPKELLLSAAVSASKAVIDEAYDVPTLAQYLDWIAIMTYDYHGHWDRKTGHVSPLYYYPGDTYDYFNTNSSVEYWMKKGAPPNKLIMGIPMYGQSFTLVDAAQNKMNSDASGPGEAGESTKANGFLAYYEICLRVKSAGWSVERDPQNRIGPYAYRGNQWVSFDDTKMVTLKTQVAMSRGLGGAMIWALDLDDFANRCGCGRHPLLRAINAVFKSQSPPTCNL